MTSPGGGVGWALAAIALWGTFAAAAGDALQGIRPATLLLYALACALAVLLALDLARGRRLAAALAAPAPVVGLGLLGLYGYHALLFAAFDRAPIVEANLVNYLWPLLIVVLAPPLAREPPRRAPLAGACAGFLGAALVITQGRRLAIAPEHAPGYLLALLAAVAWSSFSVLLRRLGKAAEDRMTLFVAASLVPAAGVALALGQAEPPPGRALLACAWLGVGPMGLATLCWSRALAAGGAARIGALSYLTPLLSTLALALVLGRPLTLATLAGMTLIIGGAAGPALLASSRAGAAR